MIKNLSFETLERMKSRFNRLYGPRRATLCLERLVALIGRYGIGYGARSTDSHWDEQRVLLIAYADIVQRADEHPLVTLTEFAQRYWLGSIDTLHLLPFFSASSDDGFSVTDYRQVDPSNGNWKEVQALGQGFYLMFDLILNHVSRQSSWFKKYTTGLAPYRDFFIEVDPAVDLSAVVRPRATSLRTPVNKAHGQAHLWATFSDDQIDLNFSNPDVLFEFLDILFFYISMRARIIRLDAIAYLWKQIGTPCIHLSQTHEIVKLLRDLLDMVAPEIVLLTETNVPHSENISYFGDRDEAHMIYQFSLPPLLLHALTTGNGQFLTDWAETVSNAPEGCTYLNFTASHDGIGVLPLVGLIPDQEFNTLLQRVQERGGQISTRGNSQGIESPYELNITYFDALGGDDFQVERFLCSQTIMLGLKGVPAIYFHSLTATPNDHDGVEASGRVRSINRKKWKLDDLEKELHSSGTPHRVFVEYLRRIQIRIRQKAFHPDAEQAILHLGDDLFAFSRSATEKASMILCISNLSHNYREVKIDPQASACNTSKPCIDLLSGARYSGTHKQISLGPYQTVWLTQG